MKDIDPIIWLGIITTLGGAIVALIIWIFNKFVDRTDGAIDVMKNILVELRISNGRHEERLDSLESDVDKLQGGQGRLVTYSKS